jgi:hypothetical protein
MSWFDRTTRWWWRSSLNNGCARGQIAIFGRFFGFSEKIDRRVRSQFGRAVSQNDEGRSELTTGAFGRLLRNLWRVCGIGSLLRYPGKTDRLEQRQGGGEIPQRLFVCAMEGTAANLFSSHLASTVSGY